MLIRLLLLLLLAAPPALAVVPTHARRCAVDLAWLKEHRPLAPVAGKIELPHDPSVDVEQGVRDLAKRGVAIMNLNAENLDLFAEHAKKHFDPLTGKEVDGLPQKPLDKVRQLAEHILAKRPDVVVMQEVAGPWSLQKFAGEFLGGEYVPLILHSNDRRGIHVAVLVKRGLPLDFTYESHINEPNADGQGKVFDRDVVALTARVPGREEPLFVVLGSHFKSKRPVDGDATLNDGTDRRGGQAEGSARIIAGIRAKYPKVPIFFAADFNNVPSEAPEFEILRTRVGLKDTIDAQPGRKPRQNDRRRISETTFQPRDARTGRPVPFPEAIERERNARNGGPKSGIKWVPISHQLDAILANQAGQKLVKSAGIDPWLDADGKPLPIPKTYEERATQPSDHRTATTEIDPTSRLVELGVDLEKPDATSPGFRQFAIPPVFSPNGDTHPFGVEDLKQDGFAPLLLNSNPTLTLSNGTVVGTKNFGKRIQQDRSRQIPRALLDRDHVILIPKSGPPVELVPDPGYTFGPVLATPRGGFRTSLREIGKDGPGRAIEFDAKGQRIP